METFVGFLLTRHQKGPFAKGQGPVLPRGIDKNVDIDEARAPMVDENGVAIDPSEIFLVVDASAMFATQMSRGLVAKFFGGKQMIHLDQYNDYLAKKLANPNLKFAECGITNQPFFGQVWIHSWGSKVPQKQIDLVRKFGGVWEPEAFFLNTVAGNDRKNVIHINDQENENRLMKLDKINRNMDVLNGLS